MSFDPLLLARFLSGGMKEGDLKGNLKERVSEEEEIAEAQKRIEQLIMAAQQQTFMPAVVDLTTVNTIWDEVLAADQAVEKAIGKDMASVSKALKKELEELQQQEDMARKTKVEPSSSTATSDQIPLQQVRETVKTALQNHVCKVVFTKKGDGKLREMIGTLKMDLLPASDSKNPNVSPNLSINHLRNPELISIYDLEKNGWRSFHVGFLEECVVLRDYVVKQVSETK